jgi:hypothetical protein
LAKLEPLPWRTFNFNKGSLLSAVKPEQLEFTHCRSIFPSKRSASFTDSLACYAAQLHASLTATCRRLQA